MGLGLSRDEVLAFSPLPPRNALHAALIYSSRMSPGKCSWQIRVRVIGIIEMRQIGQTKSRTPRVDTAAAVVKHKPTTFEKLELGVKYGSLAVTLLGAVATILTLCAKEKAPPASPVSTTVIVISTTGKEPATIVEHGP